MPIDKNVKFDLNVLVSNADISKAEQSGIESRHDREEDLWRKEHDPNYKEWKSKKETELWSKFNNDHLDKSIEELKNEFVADTLKKQNESKID